ncbi:hypothetical protein METH_19660 [Leisingera methylohalidivorans DSM 14336]|uniref:Uncharacterized protein n=1 Tax=Leisingera methylohalidivorans DSM 14336 TaxID=999552 RepID=V9VZE5_9RHOB|nr:hypothetical protein METH_19660 [Leisingera methylohalidivorans DSM 14336]
MATASRCSRYQRMAVVALLMGQEPQGQLCFDHFLLQGGAAEQGG